MFPIAKNGNKLIKQFNQPSLLSFSSLYKKEDWNTARFRTACVDWYIFTILKNIRNLFIRKEFIELDNRKKITYCLLSTYTETSYLYDMYHL